MMEWAFPGAFERGFMMAETNDSKGAAKDGPGKADPDRAETGYGGWPLGPEAAPSRELSASDLVVRP